MEDKHQTPVSYSFIPIGIIHSPFTEISGMPIQPNGARGIPGTVEIFREYKAGLRDITGFSHLFLLYAFHRCVSFSLTVTPFLDSNPHGVFATRAPKRPNAIGLSIVRLREVKETTLSVEDIDILDGTPLLDVKPYVPVFDAYPEAVSGWLEKNASGVDLFRSDQRFG
jgi:tRNA-Thr(GGU) m(6)t(6)A37 methyltransferase TsaA